MTKDYTPAKFLISLQKTYQGYLGFNIEGYGYDLLYTIQGGYSVFSEAQLKSNTVLHGREAYEQKWISAN